MERREKERENFDKAWREYMKEDIVLSDYEKEVNKKFRELWSWKGSKWEAEKENFYEIQINGVSCRRIWNSMGSALLDQNHPLNNLLDNEDPFYRNYRSHHYRCFLTEEQLKQPELVKQTDYLFGTPFYYQETWWIFQSISSEISVWDLIDCKGDSKIVGKPTKRDQKKGKATLVSLLGYKKTVNFGVLIFKKIIT